MVHPRQRPIFVLTEEETRRLQEISRCEHETPQRVERAEILLAYAADGNIAEIVRRFGCSRHKVHRCIDRALEKGILGSLTDRHRRGRPPTITPEAQRWLVSLTDREPKELGYSSDWWTTELLARHARSHCHTHGHPSLSKVSQSTVSKILKRYKVTLHEVQVFYAGRLGPMSQILPPGTQTGSGEQTEHAEGGSESP